MDMKKYYVSAALLAGILTVGIAQPTQAGKLSDGIDRLEAALAEAATNLTEEESAAVYTTRYTDVSTFLDEAEAAVNDAKAYVPYVLFANAKEKATMYAALQDTLAQLIQYETEVEAINDQYVAGNYTSAQANTALTAQLNTIVDYISDTENQTAFATMIRAVLKEKLDANLNYNQIALNALQRAETAYEEMGQDTTKLQTRLDQAQEAYDYAADAYAAGNTALEAGDNDAALKNYNQAARRMAVTTGFILKAQQMVDTLAAENYYSPTYTN